MNEHNEETNVFLKQYKEGYTDGISSGKALILFAVLEILNKNDFPGIAIDKVTRYCINTIEENLEVKKIL